jgi:tetratricopeptide (TPR) repeat protein
MSAHVIVYRRQPGLLVGLLGCVFGVLGLLTSSLAFILLAVLCSLIGFFRGILSGSALGIGTSLLGALLFVAGFVKSPSLWGITAAFVSANNPVAQNNNAVDVKPPTISQTAVEDAEMCSKMSGDAAIAACTRAISSDDWQGPSLVAAYFNRGLAYTATGDNDRAIADYNEAIRLAPEAAKAYLNRGVAYRAKGDNDRAIADFNDAIRLDPRAAKAYLNRGVAYADRGDNDSAIADYTEAIRLDPNDAQSYFNRGTFYRANGDNDRAIADYNEAIRLDPVYADAYFNRGYAYRAKVDYEHAIADFGDAIRLDPNDATAYISRGATYNAKGDNHRAIADYTEAIRINPKFRAAYFNRGLAKLYAGVLPEALADLNQASTLDPKYAYAALWVDIVGQRSKIPSRLSQAISTIDMTVWPAPVIRMFLGQMTPAAVLAAADDPDATKKIGHVCEAYFYSGEMALRTGKKAEAARLFRLAAGNCPKSFDEWSATNAELKALGMGP